MSIESKITYSIGYHVALVVGTRKKYVTLDDQHQVWLKVKEDYPNLKRAYFNQLIIKLIKSQ